MKYLGLAIILIALLGGAFSQIIDSPRMNGIFMQVKESDGDCGPGPIRISQRLNVVEGNGGVWVIAPQFAEWRTHEQAEDGDWPQLREFLVELVATEPTIVADERPLILDVEGVTVTTLSKIQGMVQEIGWHSVAVVKGHGKGKGEGQG